MAQQMAIKYLKSIGVEMDCNRCFQWVLGVGLPVSSSSRLVSRRVHRASVIEDVHGRADLLAEALEWIARETAPGSDHNHLIYLGDYVDRGHQSRNVIDVNLNAGLPAVEQVTLMGNHEEAMLAFPKDPNEAAGGLWLGVDATLFS